MIRLEELGKVIETDVLIIGGGIAGLWAANTAKELGSDVLVLDKGAKMGWSGQGYFSGGSIQLLPPGENIDEYIQDMVSLSDGLCEQDRFEKVFEESYALIKEYQGMGVEFVTDAEGKLKTIPQRGLKHNVLCLGKPLGHGGKALMAVLADKAKKLGVKYQNRIFVTGLLKQNDAVTGAVGFNTRNGKFYIFKAGATILCTGTCSMKSPYEDQLMATGNGYHLALQAGAEVNRAEFGLMWIMPKEYTWEGVTHLLPMGAEFVNGKGERFMDKYSPKLKSNCDYAFVVRSMAIEAIEGRGPFYLDCSRMSPENKEMMTPKAGWMKLQYDRLLKAGIKPFEEMQEWIQCINQTAASVVTDLGMRTKVPGLFTAGSLSHIESGVHVGGMQLLPGAVFGRYAGENAAKYAREARSSQIDVSQVALLKSDCYYRLGKKGINPEQVITEILEVTNPYSVCVLKNEKNLKNALAKIEKIRDELLPEMDASDLHYLAKSFDVQSIALMGEMFLKASLMRTESRTSHYRTDYPNRDDKNWLKWIIVSYEDGKMKLRTEPLPLDKYKIKTWQCYSDNFIFPSVKL